MKKNILNLLLLLILASCSEKIRVYTDTDSTRDIRTFSAYRWDEVKNLETANNPIYYNELNDKRIKTAVNNELQNRGYKLEDGESQLIAHYHIVINSETVSRDMTTFYHGARWLETDRNSYTLREGTLIVDLMDSKTNDLIWRGYAISVLDEFRPDLSEKMIQEAITKIFLKFPQSGN
ncbi:DUF4136 domain-containing protein [Chryseolinea sp. H1M3-3]|uniref:DUF4136 domain-containing protein n=1 Tax=Chryseolinea sp. H1M3-3 TaxID=3034144 RepID=UPI0023EB9050|nr:DUF4136 domain-containing protein [Chryseolinea sp. H1M3-3]